MKKMITFLSLLAISSSALADICGIVTRDQAEKTLSFLTKGTKLSQTYSTNPRVTVQTVTIEKSAVLGDVQYYDLKVNGESIDPGHTNILINKNVSLNLGRLVGCDAQSSDPDVIVPTSLEKSLISE